MVRALTITYPMSVEELEEKVQAEHDPDIRVRLLAIRLVKLGKAATQAARTLGMCESQTCLWVRRFNQSGPDGLNDLPRAARRSRLAPERVEAFKARVAAGAKAEDVVSVLRGQDFQRILREEFNAECSLSGTYYLLHRLGFSNLVPRPMHPASDPAAQEAFKKTSGGAGRDRCRAS